MIRSSKYCLLLAIAFYCTSAFAANEPVIRIGIFVDSPSEVAKSLQNRLSQSGTLTDLGYQFRLTTSRAEIGNVLEPIVGRMVITQSPSFKEETQKVRLLLTIASETPVAKRPHVRIYQQSTSPSFSARNLRRHLQMLGVEKISIKVLRDTEALVEVAAEMNRNFLSTVIDGLEASSSFEIRNEAPITPEQSPLKMRFVFEKSQRVFPFADSENVHFDLQVSALRFETALEPVAAKTFINSADLAEFLLKKTQLGTVKVDRKTETTSPDKLKTSVSVTYSPIVPTSSLATPPIEELTTTQIPREKLTASFNLQLGGGAVPSELEYIIYAQTRLESWFGRGKESFGLRANYQKNVKGSDPVFPSQTLLVDLPYRFNLDDQNFENYIALAFSYKNIELSSQSRDLLGGQLELSAKFPKFLDQVLSHVPLLGGRKRFDLGIYSHPYQTSSGRQLSKDYLVYFEPKLFFTENLNIFSRTLVGRTKFESDSGDIDAKLFYVYSGLNYYF